MGFPSALTTGQLTQCRTLDQKSKQFIAFCPNDVIFQTQPATAVDGSTSYAEFDWSGTDQGAYTDVLVGMTVIISTTTDYKATAIFRGRVRTAPDATTFYIDENSTNLEDTYYVTVLDDYDLHERLQKTPTLIDWDVTFETLPPLITGLQSAYVDISGAATVNFVFAATVEAIASGASISTYTWDVDDGSINSGAGTATIDVDFPGAVTNEHRWVRLTVVDDNGVSTYFVFQVFTVDLTDTSSSVIALDTNQVQIDDTIGEGFNASIRAWDGFSSILDRTRCVIFSVDDYDGMKALAFTSGGTYEVLVGDTIEGATGGATAVVQAIDLDSGSWAGGNAAGTFWINGQSGTFEAENLDVGVNSNVATITADSVNTPITQNVAFVGRLHTETSNTTGDQQYGVLQDTTFNIEGFGSQLIGLPGPGAYLRDDASPNAWGEIEDLTLKRAIVHMLARYSTFLTLCGLDFPADSDDYQWDELVVETTGMVDWIESVGGVSSSGIRRLRLIFAADGQAQIQYDARLDGTDGLTTVQTFVVDSSGDCDMRNFALERTHKATHMQVVVGAGSYNTTSGNSTIWKGRAPAQTLGQGWETATANGLIMASDLSVADAETQVKTWAGNLLAAVNPRPVMTLAFMSGYYWLIAGVGHLYAFEIAASDTTRGIAYTSADKWLCTQVSYTYNAQSGYYEPTGTFELLVAGGNVGIWADIVPPVNSLDLPNLPGISAGLTPLNPLVNLPVDDGDITLPGGDMGIIQPGPLVTNPPINCEVLNVSMKTGSIVTTTGLSAFGESYTIIVEGDAIVNTSSPTWSETFDFTISELGWAISTDFSAEFQGTYVASTGWQTTAQDNGTTGYDWSRALCIARDILADSTLTSSTLTYDYTNSGVWDGSGNTHHMLVRTPSVTVVSRNAETDGDGSGKTLSFSGSQALTSGQEFAIRFMSGRRWANADPGGQVTFTTAVFAGSGSNPFTGASPTSERGDAFYYGYDGGDGQAGLYSGSNGFQVDSARPSNVPSYNPGHVYQFTITGTGSKLGFRFLDDDYSDNQNRNLVVTVCGPDMIQG